MRRAALAFAFLAAPASAEIGLPDAQGSQTPVVLTAELVQPTDRYDHGVLGDALEWGGLRLTVQNCPLCSTIPPGVQVLITLPESRVFEDIEARLADLNGDNRREVIVVETDLARGASLAVYGPDGKIAATPFIGRRHRWLAPAGIADFDGDGRTEIAYVDRPHLRAELVIVRLEGDRLREVARLAGLTNHRIGEDLISGGVRDCGQGPELVLASPDWGRVKRVRWAEGPVAEDIGPMPARVSMRRCPAAEAPLTRPKVMPGWCRLPQSGHVCGNRTLPAR